MLQIEDLETQLAMKHQLNMNIIEATTLEVNHVVPCVQKGMILAI